eukprot:TRINITY_DN5433_c0_g1_i1.p1 TRINITY_DN5433_c0_g1~~TRINITY_DN5433_c0_g1_i1.p1  ORF type:complete len:204 (-),score=21.01 TRINITY_DN5433_c0_g1_i1:104-715(-)
MGWELRCFYPLPSDLNLWKIMKDANDKHASEDRTDIYFNLKSPKYGLKLRGGRLLELKILCEYNTQHLTEYWKKVINFPLSYLCKENTDLSKLKSEVASMLTGSSWSSEILSLLEDCQELVYTHKRRKQTYLNTKNIFPSIKETGMTIEQTDMIIEIHRKEQVIQCGEYRSICVEDGEQTAMNHVISFVAPSAHTSGILFAMY